MAKPCIFAQQSAGHAANASKKGVATVPADTYRSGAKPPLGITALKARLLARRRPFFIQGNTAQFTAEALSVASLADFPATVTKMLANTQSIREHSCLTCQKICRRDSKLRIVRCCPKITPRRPAGPVPRRAERSGRRRPPCAANGAAGPVRRRLGAKAQLFRQAGTPPPRSRSCRGGGVCFCARFSPAARIPARCVQWRPLRPRAAARW